MPTSTRRLFALGAGAAIVGMSLVQPLSAQGDGEAALNALRERVTAAAAPMLVSGADVQIKFPYAPLVAAVASLNTLPPQQRTIGVQSVDRNGYFWREENDCGASYIELPGPGDLRAPTVLSGFAAVPQKDGALDVSVAAAVALSGQIKGHYQPGKVWGVCPGGGAGTSVGVSASATPTLVARIRLTAVPERPDLAWSISLVSPNSVGVRVTAGLGALGDRSVDVDIPVPLVTAASGQLPLLLLQQGKVQIPGGGERSYTVSLKPSAFQASAWGLVASWVGGVSF